MIYRDLYQLKLVFFFKKSQPEDMRILKKSILKKIDESVPVTKENQILPQSKISEQKVCILS